jgi:hypothetical protein
MTFLCYFALFCPILIVMVIIRIGVESVTSFSHTTHIDLVFVLAYLLGKEFRTLFFFLFLPVDR